jgi:ATP-dependent Clp protease ATP-binding subunit ClpA
VVELEAQLQDKLVTLELDEEAREWIAEKGYDPKMGARPMARIIQEHIKRPLAEELLFGALVTGGHIRVRLDAEGDRLVLESEPSETPEPA